MTIKARRTKEYLKKERNQCARCGHHGRDVKVRLSTIVQITKFKEKPICNNCIGALY